MKRVVSILLFISLLFSLSIPASASEEIPYFEDAIQPEVKYDVLNDEGILETQEIISLGEEGIVPSYITHIEYLDEDSNEGIESIDQYPPISEEANTEIAIPAATSVTRYERESNNTSSSANVYNDNENMYGSNELADHLFPIPLVLMLTGCVCLWYIVGKRWCYSKAW